MVSEQDTAQELPRPFGSYTLLRLLAAGGMAEVFVARAASGKLVAIKVLHQRLSEDPHFARMLVDEAKLSVRLQHASIAQTLDLGCVDGRYFIVMEYVEGIDLSRVHRRLENTNRRMPIDAAVYILIETLGALEHAHSRVDTDGTPLRIVHRDVSPQNILLSFAGEVKLVDFGIAKATSRSSDTEVGVIKGKYVYMSPEQAWADPVDRRSDVFSAGVVLYELLTSRPLYEESDLPALLDRVRSADIAPPSVLRSEVPRELDAICLRALAPKAEARFQTALAFRQALEGLLFQIAPGYSPKKLVELVASVASVSSVPPASAESVATTRAVAPRARASTIPDSLTRVDRTPVEPLPLPVLSAPEAPVLVNDDAETVIFGRNPQLDDVTVIDESGQLAEELAAMTAASAPPPPLARPRRTVSAVTESSPASGQRALVNLASSSIEVPEALIAAWSPPRRSWPAIPKVAIALPPGGLPPLPVDSRYQRPRAPLPPRNVLVFGVAVAAVVVGIVTILAWLP